MKINITAKDESLIKACREIGWLFLPGGDFFDEASAADVFINIETTEEAGQIAAMVAIKDKTRHVNNQQREETVSGTEQYNQTKRVARLAFLRAMEEYTGKQAGPWGILTGIRPTKIIHRLLDAGWKDEEITVHLIQGYALGEAKAELLLETARQERRYLLDQKQAGELVSIYIGIPFCPSRCAYCSFPSYSMGQAGNLVEPFLKSLHREISVIGDYIKSKGLKVQTVYVGGGTPTSLEEKSFAALLEDIKANLVSEATVEFTLEAGRPDTINEKKLTAMKSSGVTRISINPQTMHPETLMAIGRNHQPWDVTDAVEIARAAGFNNINMDLIVGLPGETLDHIRETMRYLGMMGPESITLHTLAVKRASEIKENPAGFELPDSDTVVGMFDLAMFLCRATGMHPYYMYRQKQMVGPLENIGFALPGFECLYNIQMIEERQTIIGLGAGAGSKFVNPGDWTLESFYNPKDPQTYVERIEELCTQKITGLDKVFLP